MMRAAFAEAGGAPAPAVPARAKVSREALASAAQVATSGQALGELFQYVIATPVTIGRGQSAMVPIISAGMPYRKDLLYNGNKLPAHPVATLRFQNESGLTLERGPVTVMEGPAGRGEYVGEAVLPFTVAGGEVVVSYAVELAVKVREEMGSSREVQGLHIRNTYLLIEEWDVRWREYRLTNSTGQAMTVLVEHPRTAQYDLFDTPPPAERTGEQYRFEVEVLGRSGFVPSDGELTLQMILETVRKAAPEVKIAQPEVPVPQIHIPIRTRTQCVGCNYRGILNALKQTVRKHKGIVAGDIGCHDAGSFSPMELQSTIYCMGSSVPMASGMVLSGMNRPVFAFIGDSTLYHNGILGLINAASNKINVNVILGENSVTAMTGFQPHPGTGKTLAGEETQPINVPKLAEAMGISYRVVNPYNIKQCREALEAAVKEEGPSLIVSSMPCYLLSTRRGQKVFEAKEVRVNPEICNGCKICIDDFGCPAIAFDKKQKKVSIDPMTCVGCGLCVDVCKRGAIS